MFSKLRPRSAYDVMAALAMFGVLATGGAYAADEWNGSNIQDGTLTGADIQDLSLGLPDYGANSISTGKLKDGDVRTQDLRDLGVTNSKIAWDSVSSGKVINNNLTGDDINESTLKGTVEDVKSVVGPINDITVGTGFSFAGPTATLTLDGPRTVVATITGVFGSAAATRVDVEVCYRPVGAATPTLFRLEYLLVALPGTETRPVTSSLARELPAGTYDVGLCARAVGTDANDNDFTNGTVMVVR
jgi:hypothetical protein